MAEKSRASRKQAKKIWILETRFIRSLVSVAFQASTYLPNIRWDKRQPLMEQLSINYPNKVTRGSNCTWNVHFHSIQCLSHIPYIIFLICLPPFQLRALLWVAQTEFPWIEHVNWSSWPEALPKATRETHDRPHRTQVLFQKVFFLLVCASFFFFAFFLSLPIKWVNWWSNIGLSTCLRVVLCIAFA